MKVPEQSIIEKVFNNEATSEETREVVRWMATKEGQTMLQNRMNHDCEMVTPGHEEEYLGRTIPSEEIYAMIMHKIRIRRFWNYTFKIAAVLIPLALIIGIYMDLNSRVDLFASSGYEEVTVPKGERLELMFQDGSKVYLNSDSHIRYPKKFGLSERKVELSGEGWFEVAKLKDRPFIVKLNELDIQVLGTTFNVNAYKEDPNISIALNTGIIKLTGYTFKPLNLKPGDKAVYDKASGSCMIIKDKGIKKETLWKQNILVFDNTPMQSVLTQLSRRFGCEFKLKDDDVIKYNYTLKTQFTELRVILNELEKISPVKFTITGKEVLVEKKK